MFAIFKFTRLKLGFCICINDTSENLIPDAYHDSNRLQFAIMKMRTKCRIYITDRTALEHDLKSLIVVSTIPSNG